MHDLCEGMNFIHTTVSSFHGYLTGSKCLIDKHFILKIGEFGCETLVSLLANEHIKTAIHVPVKKLYWTAPEMLNYQMMPNRATDVYAVGVILLEILSSDYPYPDPEQECKCLLEKISSGAVTPLTIQKDENIRRLRPDLLACLEWTFHLDPNKRPTVAKLLRTLLRQEENFFPGSKRSDRLVDQIMERLNRYAAELEDRVAKQTSDLIKERAQCDTILRQILPGNIVEKLRRCEHVGAEVFDSVTIMFFDLYGFEVSIHQKRLTDLMDLLNAVESQTDSCVNDVDAFKVEAIGDNFMIVSGAPVCNGSRHVGEICKLAISLRSKLEKLLEGREMQLRMGLHSGSIAAGMVGFRKPRYCLFGDTVNTASRMMSHGLPGKTQMTGIAADLLRKSCSQFRMISRGVIKIKNKEPMETFWLLNEPSY
ncbi:atrial natriuretic peptide receptor 2-like [Paramacrobiotus metropolitanus]|uniref:atrial natriuretic peptide receptor 2-like n=1 Tax=Paramacrobiotus metropolitanus TaxID=2943436 RepID=UPI00244659B4|nr:atrial natriuretic peptide receptor 2-like [Paramacrobiotus metropolitanus]